MVLTELIQRYNSGRDRFISPEYNESQLRVDFIDPFFKILGWDITNEGGKSTNEREVLVEESIRMEIGKNTKKPDYSFRLFAERKFFVEAKKPSIQIQNEAEPAKQIRRYGFTAKLKISVLTNFEYLAIYDCSELVNDDDQVRKARIKLYHYTDYEEKLDEIKSYIGKEAVYSGAFDEAWEHIENQLQKYSVDDLFLDQINKWRFLLGSEIYSNNPDIDEYDLNDIVQRYINSIIFLRVCEDRNLEVYKTLLQVAQEKNLQLLISKFREADRKYNAGLFQHSLSNEVISEEGNAFWEIIKQLYYPNSHYSFSVFSSDILGHVYEVFLGEHLKIEDNQLVLKKKPEIEDRDVVTTPTFIIRNILEETVISFCDGKSADEILASKFADIACGSGAFLVECYQLIQNILIDYYSINDRSKLVPVRANTFRLKFEEKKQVLLSCIYGVDKDFNAVEACKFGLLLKLLEDENNQSITTPALPNLDSNIFFGNSLIEPEQTNSENRRLINPFDFHQLRFNVVVGNPPYLATEHIIRFTPVELPIYKSYYNSAYKQFDKYFLFVERAFELLNNDGLLGYILPIKFMKVGAGRKLRKLMVDNKAVKKIISFGANQIFDNKTTYTGILILEKNQQNVLEFFEVRDLNDWKVRNQEINYEEIEIESLNENVWGIVSGHLKPAYNLILENSSNLLSLIGAENINNGIQTSANHIYVQEVISESESYYYFIFDEIEWEIEKELTRPYFQTSRGENNLYTYRLVQSNSIVIYPYLNDNGVIRFIEMDVLRTNYPRAYAFFEYNEEKLKERNIKPEPSSENEWYRYGRHQSLEKCDVPQKIIVGVLSNGDKYAIDNQRTFISSGGTAGYCMITLPENFSYSIFYIQALLNSKYVEWFASLYGEVFRGNFIARGTKVLKKLPIKVIDFDNENEKRLHDSIAEIQENLIRIQTDIDSIQNNQRRLIPLKREFEENKIALDNDLKELYNLGEEDSLVPQIETIYAVE